MRVDGPSPYSPPNVGGGQQVVLGFDEIVATYGAVFGNPYNRLNWTGTLVYQGAWFKMNMASPPNLLLSMQLDSPNITSHFGRQTTRSCSICWSSSSRHFGPPFFPCPSAFSATRTSPVARRWSRTTIPGQSIMAPCTRSAHPPDLLRSARSPSWLIVQ